MRPSFPTDLPSILDRIDAIDPMAYAGNRNYVDGAVTYLSPYISRGVISTRQVLERVLQQGHRLDRIEVFVKELAWRDHFQRIWQHTNIDQDIKRPQEDVAHVGIPASIIHANTGIEGIDEAIQGLYATGYMHNHCRMYTASIACNIGKGHWRRPALWMYYHLLDGDWGSNACSWQWVAGCNSNKKYFADQQNISRYTRTPHQPSFLDRPYEELPTMDLPGILKETMNPDLPMQWPETKAVVCDSSLPTYIYNYYNLDTRWHEQEAANRILLLEPSVFERYPISAKCMAFMLGLAANINGIQVYIGSFESLVNTHGLNTVIYKEHPLNAHYKGIQEERDWLSDRITGLHPSFFAYWKRLHKELLRQYA